MKQLITFTYNKVINKDYATEEKNFDLLIFHSQS